jgi:hypothetical protein
MRRIHARNCPKNARKQNAKYRRKQKESSTKQVLLMHKNKGLNSVQYRSVAMIQSYASHNRADCHGSLVAAGLVRTRKISGSSSAPMRIGMLGGANRWMVVRPSAAATVNSARGAALQDLRSAVPSENRAAASHSSGSCALRRTSRAPRHHKLSTACCPRQRKERPNQGGETASARLDPIGTSVSHSWLVKIEATLTSTGASTFFPRSSNFRLANPRHGNARRGPITFAFRPISVNPGLTSSSRLPDHSTRRLFPAAAPASTVGSRLLFACALRSPNRCAWSCFLSRNHGSVAATASNHAAESVLTCLFHAAPKKKEQQKMSLGDFLTDSGPSSPLDRPAKLC